MGPLPGSVAIPQAQVPPQVAAQPAAFSTGPQPVYDAAAASATPPPPAPPQLSPDGRWMWDGTQWVPAAAPPPPPPPPGAGYPMAGMPYGGPVAGGGTNGLAIASLVLGILWLWGVGSVLAVVFGHVGQRQIRERGQGGKGLATAGLVLGYLGIVGAIFFFVLVGQTVHNNRSEEHAVQVQSDLRNAATAEESTLTDTNVYTTSLSTLETEGFLPRPGTEIAIAANGTSGYCLVGSYEGKGDWYIYDSQAGGLWPTTYGSIGDAESVCTVGGGFASPE